MSSLTIKGLYLSLLITLIASPLLTCEAVESDQPPAARKLIATRSETPPVIDGRLDDDCWQQSAEARDFSVFQYSQQLHPEQTIGRVCFDDDNIYISMECTVNEIDKFKARLAVANGKYKYSHGGVIEVFVDLNRDKKTFQQYLLHANGTSAISLPENDLFGILNEDYLISQSQITDKGFNIEMSFPLAMLHLQPDTAEVWGFNLNRVHDLYDERHDRNGFFSSWNSTQAMAFGTPELFGELVVNADFSRFYWEVDFVREPQAGDAKVQLLIKNKTGRKFSGRLTLDLVPPQGKTATYTKNVSLTPGQAETVSFKHFVSAEDVEAQYRIKITDQQGQVCYLGGTQKRDTTPGDSWAAPSPNADQQKTGFIVFRRPFSQPVLYKAVPKSNEIVSELSLSACRGEFEPVNFSLYPIQDVRSLNVTVGDLIGPDGAVIPRSAIDVRKVMWQSDWANVRTFEAKEHLLRRCDVLSLAARRTQRLYLNIRIPQDATAGEYLGKIDLTSAQGTTSLTLNVQVLPFELSAADGMGYFMYYPGVKHKMFSTPEFFRKTVVDMREHGMTSFTIYNWIKSKDPQTGKEFVDVDNNARDSYGVTYAEMMDILRNEGIGDGVPIMDVFSMHYGPEMIVELDKICRSRDNWPEVLFYINDEISYDERIAAARKVLEKIKKLAPNIKTTTAMGPKGAKALGHLYDVWIGATTPEMLEECRSMGKSPWTYSCRETVDVSPAFERAFFGKFAWQLGLRGVGLWSYTEDDSFFNRFNRKHKYEGFKFSSEWKQYYGHVLFEEDEIIPTVTWEAVREGIDDYRYMLTLKKHADKALDSDKESVRQAARNGLKLLKDISAAVPYLSDDKIYGRAWQEMGDMDGERTRVINAILELQK
jgi:hypothetical protein